MSMIIERMQADLLTARKSSDKLKVATLQSVLARITNAEAVPIALDAASLQQPASGVGSTEVARRILSEEDIVDIIQEELDELNNAIADMNGHTTVPYAAELSQKAQILRAYIATNV